MLRRSAAFVGKLQINLSFTHLHDLCNMNIAKYEKQFGTIKLNGAPAPGSTIPMSFGGGQA